MREFFIADLHLGHERLITGWNNDGQGPRKQFADAEAMGRHIIGRWNSVVGPTDIVYVPGDVALKEPALKLFEEMNGRKRVVLGNHDHARAAVYSRYFERIYGAKVMPGGFVVTHIPVHPNSLDRKSMQVNIHGHLHEAVVTQELDDPEYLFTKRTVPDPRYVCVSCEQVNYAPISFDEIKARVAPFLQTFQPKDPLGTSLISASDHPAAPLVAKIMSEMPRIPFVDNGPPYHSYNRDHA